MIPKKRYVKNFPIKELVIPKTNPRDHPEENLKAIEASIQEFGLINPVVVREETKEVIAGAGWIMSLEALSIDRVDVLFVDLDELQALGYQIADNQTAVTAKWNEPQLLANVKRQFEEAQASVRHLGFNQRQLEAITNAAQNFMKDWHSGTNEEDPGTKKSDSRTPDAADTEEFVHFSVNVTPDQHAQIRLALAHAKRAGYAHVRDALVAICQGYLDANEEG